LGDISPSYGRLRHQAKRIPPIISNWDHQLTPVSVINSNEGRKNLPGLLVKLWVRTDVQDIPGFNLQMNVYPNSLDFQRLDNHWLGAVESEDVVVFS
jgi:hypothetical protein